MHVLLTNDDGYRASGARALARAVRALGWSAVMVAPAAQMSGTSRSRSSAQYVWEEADAIEGFNTVFVEATPAACVVFALTSGVFGDFDLCLSGINAGENLGYCLSLSGTLGAAIEAAAHGVRSMALSRQYEMIGTDPESWDWSWVASAAARAIHETLQFDLPQWRIANINLPSSTAGTPLAVASVSPTPYFDSQFDLSLRRIVSTIGYDKDALRENDDITLFAERGLPTVSFHDGRIS